MQNDHVQKTVLENGVRVLSERMDDARSAGIRPARRRLRKPRFL